MSYADIETRSRLSRSIGSNLAGIGRGYADTALTKYQVQLDQRRMQREDEIYRQKQTIFKQEQDRERAGSRLVSILASGMPAEQMYQQIQGLQGEFENIDLAGTDAGRGMFGYYGRMGVRASDTAAPGQMTTEESQMSKYMAAKRKAEETGDTLTAELMDEKLGQMPRYQTLQKRVDGPVWLSGMKAGGFAEFVEDEPKDRIKGRLGTFDKRYGNDAYAAALQKALAKGGLLGLPAERITSAFNEWWDKEHEKNKGRWQTYADRTGFSQQGPAGSEMPTPEELRAKNTKEAYETGRKLGYWK